MKNTNKLIRSAVVLCALLIMTVSGCSNGNDIKSKNDFQEKSYSVSGSINLLDTNDRSATTSFTRLDSLNYSVVAYKGTSSSYEENSAVTASLGGSASNITYSFKLPEAGNWYIVASAKLSIEDEVFVDILTGSKEVDVPDQMAAYNVDAITLNLTGFTENASGSINLVIYDHTNEVSKVDISAKALISKNSVLSQRKISKSGLTFTGTYEPGLTERTLTLEYEDISSDCYEIEFNFMNSNNKKIYSCKEAVTVLGGFVTDKWLQGSSGTGAHLVYDSYNNSTKFIITDELLNSYNQAGDLDYPVVLWNNLDEEYEIESYNSAYGAITFKVGTDYEGRAKAFGKVTNGTRIDDKGYIDSYTTPVFCFDNYTPTSMYYLDYDKIYKYKHTDSYSGLYTEDDTFEPINLSELIGTTFNAVGVQGSCSKIYPAMDYYDGYLFFFFAYDVNSTENVYLGAVDTEGTELLYMQTADEYMYETSTASGNTEVFYPIINAISVDSVDGNVILCYSNDSPFNHGSITIMGLNFTGSDNGLDSISSLCDSITYDDSIFGLQFARYTDRAIISDLQILNDVLYVALYSYYLVGQNTQTWIDKDTPHEPYCDSYFKINNSYVRKPVFLSNGGIAKVDLTKKDPQNGYSFATWEKAQTKIIGWHTGTIYDDDEGTNPQIVTTPPTPADDNQYFYGARKFIAKKQEELIIADDGGYIDMNLDDVTGDPSYINACANKNRVVTVDLYDEAISSVVDVDVTFDTSFNKCYDRELNISDTYFGYGFSEF